MKNKLLLIFLMFALLALPITAACEAEPEGPIEISYANFGSMQTFLGKGMQDWADELERRSEGSVKIVFYPDASLLGPMDMHDGIVSGVADIGGPCCAYFPGRYPMFSTLELPIGMPSGEVASGVLWDMYQKFKPEAFDDVKVIYVYTTAPAHLMTMDPIRSLDDLKDYETRCTAAGVPIMEAWGAIPVAMPHGEVYDALAKGIIEGNYTATDSLQVARYGELINYITRTNGPLSTFAVVMNLETWNSLPGDIQDIIDDMSREYSMITGRYADSDSDAAAQWSVDEHGVQWITLSPEELDTWFSLLQPIIDAWLNDMEDKGLPGQEWLDEAYRLK